MSSRPTLRAAHTPPVPRAAHTLLLCPRAQRKAHASWQKALQASDGGAEARAAAEGNAEPLRVPVDDVPAQRALPEVLSLQLLQELTQGFSPSRAVGEGGFATVYRAELPPAVCPGAPSRLAAIKRGQSAGVAVDSG